MTPTSRSARHIRQTLQSVVGQCGDFAIEHIVVDNASKDGTLDIVADHQRALERGAAPLGCRGVQLRVVSEPDRGMYDAINKGFALATGDIHAWINADDVYLPGALDAMARAFVERPDVQWVKGITSYMTDTGTIWKAGRCALYAQEWLRAGAYNGEDAPFVQQDSVFWRADLWRRAGGADATLRLAGDYDLWVKFAALAPLVSLRALVSCFRTVQGQMSQRHRAEYVGEVARAAPPSAALRARIRRFFQLEPRLPRRARPLALRVALGRPELRAITIDRDGLLRWVSGEYYDVLAAVG